ncbi:biotin--protein ligase [Clonorchis sinensis]|uniref:Biotin--protein ligase n=1 Tax=Clonorchis sinensis TaxID=79923 RepID=G7Y916_CLOSI|nr:biotin--protein ligase [Clonorchis sinensis]
MASWSATCSVRMGRNISTILSKMTAKVMSRDSSAVNLYQLLPSTDQPTTDLYGSSMRIIDRLVDDQYVVPYPLRRSDFFAELWQTTAKLLVVFDERESINTCGSASEFDHEFSLVCQFLADGGKVLLLLNSSASTENTLNPTSLGHLLSAPRVVTPPLESSQWKWRIHASTASVPHSRILVGSPDETRANLVITSINPLDSRLDSLRQGLELLHIPCRSLTSHIHEKPSNSVTLYSMIMDSHNTRAKKALSIFSEPSTLAGLGDFTHAELRDCSTLSNLPAEFDWLGYRKNLNTDTLGKNLIWSESLGSSWALCESVLEKIPPHSGLVVVSNRQTQGHGRGDNRWVTPSGQAAFTLSLTLNPPTYVSPRSAVTFANYVTGMQHLVALSILLACKQLIAERLGALNGHQCAFEVDEEFLVNLQYSGPQICLKWPNDVYVVWNESKQCGDVSSPSPNCPRSGKLAGMLTRCSLGGDKEANFIIGIGVNVSNHMPTICLQDLLDRVCSKQPSVISTAEVIATILSRLERLVSRTLHTYGLSWAFELYTRCWMHTNQTVEVRSNKNGSPTFGRQCTITGLDSFGYLLVRDNETGERFSLHPDGNSMDMMLGLIKPK